MLDKQKLVDAFVRRRGSRHELEEGLVHKQHEAELLASIQSMNTHELGETDGLDLEQARVLWGRMLPARVNDLLWELSDERREALAPGREPDLEVSARLHIGEDDAFHLHSNFLVDRAGDSRSVPVAFVLRRGILFTLRDEELPVFRLHGRRAGRRHPGRHRRVGGPGRSHPQQHARHPARAQLPEFGAPPARQHQERLSLGPVAGMRLSVALRRRAQGRPGLRSRGFPV